MGERRTSHRHRHRHRPHLLIVSDDADLASFLAEGLIYAGFWASVVASPFQTLEIFRLRSFDLVLLDGALGGFGALELLRRLRGGSDRAPIGGARSDVPVFLVAADEVEVNAAEASIAGAAGVFVAPLAIEEMIPRLAEAVAAWRHDHPDRPWADQAVLDPTLAGDGDR